MFGLITGVCNWHSFLGSPPTLPPTCPLAPLLHLSSFSSCGPFRGSGIPGSLPCGCSGHQGWLSGSPVGMEGDLGLWSPSPFLPDTLPAFHTTLDCPPCHWPRAESATRELSKLIQYAFHQNMYLTTFPPNLASLHGLFFPRCPR